MGFSWLDYSVLGVYLVATAAFGAWLGRGQKDVRDYFLAGGRLPWWAICFSIVATETSTLTFIGAPAIAYEGNLTFLQVAVGYVMGKILVSSVLIPAYFKGEIETAYELLKFRFGPRVRNFSALLFQVNRVLADGVRLFATALVLSVVTQLTDVWTVVIIGVITVVYTFYGGMTAVVWNDVVQLVIYIGGAILAGWLILERIPGGWSEVMAVADAAGKLRVIDPSLVLNQPYTLLAGLIGGAFLTFATHGTDQMMVQRYLACRRERDSQIALILSGVLVVFQFLLFLMIGVMLFAFYQEFPLGREIEQANRIFPIFIVEQMPSGISGLVIAAVFAAAMSTLSSSLNSLSSSFINDFYKVYIVREASREHYLKASRLVTLGWAVILIAVSMLARNWGEVLQAGLTITSVTMGSVLGIFLLGQWSPKTGETAGLVGMVTALAVMLGVHFTGLVAWTWFVLIGTVVTYLTGVLVQKVLGNGAVLE